MAGAAGSALADFYSHALVGRDRDSVRRIKRIEAISTHTPSWGVTAINAPTTADAAFLLTRPRGA